MCRSKQNGGLGLRHIKEQNKAFMVKLGWGLMEKKDALWARVLRAKYKCGNDLVPTISKPQNSSRLWKGIANSWKHMEEGTIWHIGDGRRVRFWADPWLPNGNCPMSYALGSIDSDSWNLVTVDFVTSSMWVLVIELLGGILRMGHFLLKHLIELLLMKQIPRILVFGSIFGNGRGWKGSDPLCDFMGITVCLPMRLGKGVVLQNRKRNEVVFNDHVNMTEDPIFAIKQLVRVYKQAYAKSLRIASCGGVLRDCAGNFVKGFVRKLSWCDTLLPELWAILSAREVAWSMGCRNLVVASDSLMAINLLKNQIHDNHPYATIISRIHHWVAVDWDVSFLHCFREGNFATDAVAGMACNAFGAGLSLLHSVPAGLEPILRREDAGVGVARC
ncbi:ribonuclease H [Senna tora]|uniref:Ribonuclease H n=1 Tax=Senna tora TaxID=362788 RepID=A0A834SZG1_9FABA|nr:ribonuclease H [Senna tora]